MTIVIDHFPKYCIYSKFGSTSAALTIYVGEIYLQFLDDYLLQNKKKMFALSNYDTQRCFLKVNGFNDFHQVYNFFYK